MLLRSGLWALGLLLFAAGAHAQRIRVPVVLHAIAVDEQACQAFVQDELAHANELFGPLGLELVLTSSLPLAVRHAELVTRVDRDALAHYVRRGAIHWFVVNKLMDVDEPGRERRGVHWHERGDKRRHFVVVSKISGPFVFAHELGHYFGNPAHSPVAGNIMSYERGEGAPFFDDLQKENVRTTLARMLASRELVAITLDAGVGRAATKD